MTNESEAKIVAASHLRREPYRLFFPLGTAAGLAGVLLWPLHFSGVASFYPGLAHARLLTNGFFAAFIVGFLGTAFPRLISTFPLSSIEFVFLLLLHAAMVVLYSLGEVRAGDFLFLLFLATFLAGLAVRFTQRKDLPPPAFVMVGSGMFCGLIGAVLGAWGPDAETHQSWIALQKLLSYQGFILLPILGVAGFLIPRFFGLQSQHEFPEMLTPSAAWLKKAALAAAVVIVILASFVLEAWGWSRLGPLLRFAVTALYCLIEIPLFGGFKERNVFAWVLRAAFLFLLAGFVWLTFYPGYRVAILHTTLAGGFALITFTVATRVIFGHSGNLALLKKPNRWFLVVVGFMTLGILTRISGDLWPKTMEAHYIYGAILWIGGLVLWAVRVLPKVRIQEEED